MKYKILSETNNRQLVKLKAENHELKIAIQEMKAENH